MFLEAIKNIKYQKPKGHSPLPCAVHCWYPVESDPIPTMLKIKEQDSEVITIKKIEVISCEYIKWEGRNLIEYHCYIATPSQTRREVYLHYYTEHIHWTISAV